MFIFPSSHSKGSCLFRPYSTPLPHCKHNRRMVAAGIFLSPSQNSALKPPFSPSFLHVPFPKCYLWHSPPCSCWQISPPALPCMVVHWCRAAPWLGPFLSHGLVTSFGKPLRDTLLRASKPFSLFGRRFSLPLVPESFASTPPHQAHFLPHLLLGMCVAIPPRPGLDAPSVWRP